MLKFLSRIRVSLLFCYLVFHKSLIAVRMVKFWLIPDETR